MSCSTCNITETQPMWKILFFRQTVLMLCNGPGWTFPDSQVCEAAEARTFTKVVRKYRCTGTYSFFHCYTMVSVHILRRKNQ